MVVIGETNYIAPISNTSMALSFAHFTSKASINISIKHKRINHVKLSNRLYLCLIVHFNAYFYMVCINSILCMDFQHFDL